MKKILIPLWSSQGRDFQMMMPIVYYLEEIKKCNVQVISMWDWYLVDKIKPDLIIFPNIEGAMINYRLAKYLQMKKYPIISLTSEGNYIEDYLDDFIWGNNSEKKLIEDVKYLWSERCYDMVIKKYPDLKPRLNISGGVGFDRYLIYDYFDKKTFLEKYGKCKYNKVVGYATWAFDRYLNDSELNYLNDDRLTYIINQEKKKCGEFLYGEINNLKLKLNKILCDIVLNNKDILFILKLHPGTVRDDLTEISKLNFDNVIILKNEEEIADIINVCDIWMAFNSTTCLEAWLLKKPTINLLQPPDQMKKHNLIFEGTIITPDYETIQGHIDEFYQTGVIRDFEKLHEARISVIKRIIQNDDGHNHTRTAEDIYQSIKKVDSTKIILDMPFINCKLYIIHIMKKVSKYIKRLGMCKTINFVQHQVLDEDIEYFKKEYYPYLDAFHERYNER